MPDLEASVASGQSSDRRLTLAISLILTIHIDTRRSQSTGASESPPKVAYDCRRLRTVSVVICAKAKDLLVL